MFVITFKDGLMCTVSVLALVGIPKKFNVGIIDTPGARSWMGMKPKV